MDLHLHTGGSPHPHRTVLQLVPWGPPVGSCQLRLDGLDLGGSGTIPWWPSLCGVWGMDESMQSLTLLIHCAREGSSCFECPTMCPVNNGIGGVWPEGQEPQYSDPVQQFSTASHLCFLNEVARARVGGAPCRLYSTDEMSPRVTM